jgi:filamentous hemagglutinin
MLGVQQPDRLPVLSEKLRLKYETPAYGLVAEVGMGLLAGRAASGFGSGVRAVAVTAERDMFALGGAKAGPAMEPGAFSISNWNGYPAGVPKPQGTFRLLEGAEYTSARDAANTANKAIRKEQGLVGLDVDVHEVKPVKFNGSPTDPGNKLVLPRDVHRQQVTPWWNQLMRDISGQ